MANDTGPTLKTLHAVPPARQYLKEIWDRRDFAMALPMEQLQSQHQTTLLGNAWHLTNPLLSVAVYYVIFGILLSTAGRVENYVTFLMIGIFSFTLTTKCFVDGARSVSGNTGLMRAVRFPRALLPISAVISNFMTYMFELVILAGVAILTGESISQRWLLLPFVLLLHATLNLGLAFIGARLNDAFRDVQQLIPFVMRLAMYGSGVMFDVRSYAEGKPEWIQLIVKWNPFIELVDLYRWVFLGSSVDLASLARLVGISALLVVVGFRFFVAAEPRYGRS